jgi:hypothetical protein
MRGRKIRKMRGIPIVLAIRRTETFALNRNFFSYLGQIDFTAGGMSSLAAASEA